jgi:membrane protein
MNTRRRAERVKETVVRRKGQIEANRRVSFVVEARRRFKEIEGSHLALVIGANAFIAVIPLLIIGYAFIEAFNPQRSFGTVLIGRFHLEGATADIVGSTFTTAKAGKSVALSIGVISLLITGIDIAGTVGIAYSRAFRMSQPLGWRRYARGAAWLIALLAMTSLALTIRYWASSRPWWFPVVLAPLAFGMTLLFYWATPRLVLDLPFGWRSLFPGALISALLAVCLNVASTFVLASWFSWYGQAYGSFGVALAMMSWIGIVSVFWVAIAAVQGVYWESRADAAAVQAVERASDMRSEDLDDDHGPTVVGDAGSTSEGDSEIHSA